MFSQLEQANTFGNQINRNISDYYFFLIISFDVWGTFWKIQAMPCTIWTEKVQI